jgi:Family of unknown function (DUF5670)
MQNAPATTWIRILSEGTLAKFDVQYETEVSMFLILFVVLLVAWLLGFTMFHVASALIHLLLILAVISIILHFVRGRGRTA